MDNEIITKEKNEQYMDGFQNRFIRMYFYTSNGLAILNEFRNLFLGIFGLYIALKLGNIWLAVGLFIGATIVLTVVGWYVIHKVSKVREYIGMKFATHYAIKSFNYQKDQIDLLTEIRDLLLQDKNR